MYWLSLKCSRENLGHTILLEVSIKVWSVEKKYGLEMTYFFKSSVCR